MLDKLTIAQRLWLWAILATLLFFAAVGFGWYALFHAREIVRRVSCVSERTTVLSASAARNAESAAGLDQLAKTLDRLSARFRLG